MARDPVVGDGSGTTLDAVGGRTITRRRALALGALAAGGSLLGARIPEAFAARRPAKRRARGFGLDVRPGDFRGTTTRVLRAPRRFDVVGVRGGAGLEVRVRRTGGRWT